MWTGQPPSARDRPSVSPAENPTPRLSRRSPRGALEDADGERGRDRQHVCSLMAAPVGFCARSESTTAGTRGPSTRSSDSGLGPSSSTLIGTATRPRELRRSRSAGNVGSSTATRSPGRTLSRKRRSMASRLPLVTATGPAATPSAANSPAANAMSAGTSSDPS